MYQRILATLLHYANSSPPWNIRHFYALKHRLLKRYATFLGHDMQEIRKECWGPWNDWDGPSGCPGASCRKCRGTGIYDIRWHRLERWWWLGYTFHVPSGSTIIRPKTTGPMIQGRIEHKDYGRLSGEAVLWLYLLCGEWWLLWKAMKSSCACGWYFWPMLNLQRVVMRLSMWLRWHRCYCGKWFPTWGSGWRICKSCRNPSPAQLEEIPF